MGERTPSNGVEFGWGAPPMKEQHPILADNIAAHFDKDNAALIRMSVRSYLTDSQKQSAMRKITASVGKQIRADIANSKEEPK